MTLTELPAACPDSTEQVSTALHAVDAFNSTDSHKTKLLTQFVSTDSTTVTSCSAINQECHSTFKPQIIEDVPSALQNTDKDAATDDIKAKPDVTIDYNEAKHYQSNVHQLTIVEAVNRNQIELSTVPISLEVDDYADTITTVDNATPVHVTPTITGDEEVIAFVITKHSPATTETTEQTLTATETSAVCTDSTKQPSIPLPTADTAVCIQEHITELQTQVTDTDPTAIHTQSTMLQNSESNSTPQI